MHTGLKIFVDKIKGGTTSLTGVYNCMKVGVEDVVLGGQNGGTGNPFYGYYDFTIIANTEFTETEMYRLHTKSINGYELY